MKKVMGVFVVCLLLGGTPVTGQVQEGQQLLLNVEKLAQLKNTLEDMKKGYRIVSHGYTTIKNLAEGNFRLHQGFLDGLLDVSPVVKAYRRIGEIIQAQLRLIREYKTAYRQFVESGQFTKDEIDYLGRVYQHLFNGSVKNLEALAMVITAGKLRMSDDERLTTIDTIWDRVSESLIFLRRFNEEAKVLLLQRVKAGADLRTQQKLFSINK